MKLPDGLIFQIASDAGIELPHHGDKRPCRCPFHDDRNASAFVSGNGVFFCSVCTTDGGWSTKRFCKALTLDWNAYVRGLPRDPQPYVRPPPKPKAGPVFGSLEANQVWSAAKARARDDDAVEDDHLAYEYIASRSLTEAFELGIAGVIGFGMTLPSAVSRWPSRGYRIVCPLYDLSGTLVNVQARSVTGRTPRLMTPKGSKLAGTVFADAKGLALIRGETLKADTVVLGEGLTDMLALAIGSPVPVLAAPGTSNAVAAVGRWARDRIVILALDNDDAGNEAAPRVANAVYQHGGRRVLRVAWPNGATDACDVVTQLGMAGLYEFLRREIARRAA
jgi:hypothetical protein